MNETGSQIAKAYEFSDVETRWYKAWLDAEVFKATHRENSPDFSVVIPPPNVTGVLHIGHALNNTLQDVLVRYKRMDGYNTLWMPGTDHAGIATQNVVERQLKAEGTHRDALGRDAFIERVWQWKKESGGRIIHQLKRLGASCDWSRERFTMDEGLSKAVREVFVRLYEEGLIYKGDYIINWCPRCHTALADIEVEHEPVTGSIWRIKYPVSGVSSYVVVATTRPETMLGDTGVAVNPSDERYRHLIGRNLILPLVNREIPVVADDAVDVEFGTGAVKVTPAHDFNDFEIARRHNLASVNIFDVNARVNENGGKYAGLDRYEARKAVLEDLQTLGLLEAEDPHSLAMGCCYRCRTVVEPRVSKQWFVHTAPLAKKALEAVRDGRTNILPDSWFRTYEEWLTNIRDWCISRQIWWGHRIPAWNCLDCGEVMVAREEPKVCSKCAGSRLEQEHDVLDTWFSSALWPFSTLGWPEQTDDLKRFYPTSVLITSFDILFFWVARMMMMGIHFMKDVPFRYVYLHALVRDAQGHKMSKSKGNVIDPLVVMEKYGTDAVRFTLAALAAHGRDIKLAEDRIDGYRHFVNKIWNASRLVLMNLDGAAPEIDYSRLTLRDRWILARLDRAVSEIRSALDRFDFDVAARELYGFFWREFCDWYLEFAKQGFYSKDSAEKTVTQAVSLLVLDYSLRLLHPFMPFVTEELWHHLPGRQGFICVQDYPKPCKDWQDDDAETSVGLLIEIITGIRNIRAEMNVHPAVGIQIIVVAHTEFARRIVEDELKALQNLARVEQVEFLDATAKRPSGVMSVVLDQIDVHVPLAGIINVEAELGKLKKEQSKLIPELEKLNAKLANPGFLQKAKEEVVQKEREKADGLMMRLKRIEEGMRILQEVGG